MHGTEPLTRIHRDSRENQVRTRTGWLSIFHFSETPRIPPQSATRTCRGSIERCPRLRGAASLGIALREFQQCQHRARREGIRLRVHFSSVLILSRCFRVGSLFGNPDDLSYFFPPMFHPLRSRHRVARPMHPSNRSSREENTFVCRRAPPRRCKTCTAAARRISGRSKRPDPFQQVPRVFWRTRHRPDRRG